MQLLVRFLEQEKVAGLHFAFRGLVAAFRTRGCCGFIS